VHRNPSAGGAVVTIAGKPAEHAAPKERLKDPQIWRIVSQV
jgi:hypothetical protein